MAISPIHQLITFGTMSGVVVYFLKQGLIYVPWMAPGERVSCFFLNIIPSTTMNICVYSFVGKNCINFHPQDEGQVKMVFSA